jgi:hypothetical protein
MSSISDLEKEVLALPAAEREQLATAAWESLVGDPGALSDPDIDPGGSRLRCNETLNSIRERFKPLDTPSSRDARVVAMNES